VRDYFSSLLVQWRELSGIEKIIQIISIPSNGDIRAEVQNEITIRKESVIKEGNLNIIQSEERAADIAHQGT